MGPSVGSALGAALRSNETLETLDLSGAPCLLPSMQV
jgi:hypothetical protein